MSATINDLLAEFGDGHEYTHERFEEDRKRLLARISEKHGIQESEVEELIRTHNYTNSAEDPEDEYISIMALARSAGWEHTPGNKPPPPRVPTP